MHRLSLVVESRGALWLWCVAPLVECELSMCGVRAQLPRSMWNLPGPGTEPMSPPLAGEFLSIGPPGKSKKVVSGHWNLLLVKML